MSDAPQPRSRIDLLVSAVLAAMWLVGGVATLFVSLRKLHWGGFVGSAVAIGIGGWWAWQVARDVRATR